MTKLICVGSVGLDDVKTPFGNVTNALGGSAVYFSVGASFFSPVGMVSVAGRDFPKEHMNFLKSRGIDLSGFHINSGKTFRWAGAYEHDMNEAKTIKTELNAFEGFRPELPESYKNADYVFLCNIGPALQKLVLEQVKKPKFIAMDSMNFWIDRSREELIDVIKRADLLLLNESEVRQLFNTSNLVKAAKESLRLGPEYVLIKRGEHGATLFSNSSIFSLPGYPLENVLDPTGAGDSFAGGVMGWLAKTGDLSYQNIKKAVIYGSSIASFNAEGFSLEKLKAISLNDIEGRYKEFKTLIEF